MLKSSFSTVIFFLVFLLFSIASGEDNVGTVTGRLLCRNGDSMGGGTVLFYNAAFGQPPSKDKYWRMPDVVTRMDDNSRFTAKLTSGTYYLGAIKRNSGKKIGPPEKGDLIFVSHDEKGNLISYTVKGGEKIDVGVIAKATPYQAPDTDKEVTAIEGVFLDAQGKPVEGAMVFAYATPQMNTRPVYVSEMSGKDGRFKVGVPESGTYYLKARNGGVGGPPQTGETIGYYGDGTVPGPVTVKAGQIFKGIVIKGKSYVSTRRAP